MLQIAAAEEGRPVAETAEREEKSTPTSSPPTTNEELGVLGAQAAREQDRRQARIGNGEGVKFGLNVEQRDANERFTRTRAIELAHEAFSFGIIQQDAILATATKYLTFIKGENHG